MSKLRTIRLKESEISHIVSVLRENEREGWYYGNVKQYWKRHGEIIDKLIGTPSDPKEFVAEAEE